MDHRALVIFAALGLAAAGYLGWYLSGDQQQQAKADSTMSLLESCREDTKDWVENRQARVYKRHGKGAQARIEYCFSLTR